MADSGYDVADYRAIDPLFGDLAEAEGLIADALALGIRTIIDIVPDHVLRGTPMVPGGPGGRPHRPERDRFWFRDGLGTFGALAPNRWESEFGGPAWSRVHRPGRRSRQWYLHLFAPGRPNLNWQTPDVRRDHEDILGFWFDRGIAGIPMDSAALVAKDPALPENHSRARARGASVRRPRRIPGHLPVVAEIAES